MTPFLRKLEGSLVLGDVSPSQEGEQKIYVCNVFVLVTYYQKRQTLVMWGLLTSLNFSEKTAHILHLFTHLAEYVIQ